MNEPIGRFGSCRPERLRRTALATASTASSWPTSRWWMRSSSTSSLARSVSIIRRDGDAGPGADDLGDFLRADLLAQQPPAGVGRLVVLLGSASGCRAARPASSAGCPARRAADSRSSLTGMPADCFSLIAAASWLYCELDVRQPLADLLDVAQAALFQFPLLAEVGQLAAQLVPSPPRSRPGAAGRAPRSLRPAAGRPVRAAPAAAAPRRSRSARSPAPSPAGWWPRPSGRWPCRAGSGRRCSGATDWPRPPGPSP